MVGATYGHQDVRQRLRQVPCLAAHAEPLLLQFPERGPLLALCPRTEELPQETQASAFSCSSTFRHKLSDPCTPWRSWDVCGKCGQG